MNAQPARAPEQERRDYALPEEIARKAQDDREPASIRNVVIGRLVEALAGNKPYDAVSHHADPIFRFWTLAYAYLAPETVQEVLKQAMGKKLPLPASEFPPDEQPPEYSKNLADLDRAITESAVSVHPNAPVSALDLLSKEGTNPSARQTAVRRLRDQAFCAAWEETDKILTLKAEGPDARMRVAKLADLLLNEKQAYPGPACAIAQALTQDTGRLAQVIDLRGEDGGFGPRIVTEIVRRYPVAAAAIFIMVLTRFLDDAPIMAAIAGSPHLSDVLASHLTQNPRTPTQALEVLSENKNPQVREWAKKALADRKENGNARTDRIQKAVRSTPQAVKDAIQGTAAAMVLDLKAGEQRLDAGIAGAVAQAQAPIKADDDWLEKAPAAEYDPELDGDPRKPVGEGNATAKESSSFIDVKAMAEAAVAKKIETKTQTMAAPSVTDRDADRVAKSARGGADYPPTDHVRRNGEAAKSRDHGTEQITLRHKNASNDLERTRAAHDLLDHQESKRIAKPKTAAAADTAGALEPKIVTERPGVGDSSSAARAIAQEWPGLLEAIDKAKPGA